MVEEFEPFLKSQFPEARVRVRKYGLGPSNTYKFEARFSGPAEADPETLLALAGQGMDPTGPIYLLAAMLFLALSLLPLAIATAVRISLD